MDARTRARSSPARRAASPATGRREGGGGAPIGRGSCAGTSTTGIRRHVSARAESGESAPAAPARRARSGPAERQTPSAHARELLAKGKVGEERVIERRGRVQQRIV